jgi:hypothetical protein
MLVTAGGLRGADQIWVAPRHAAFLVPGRALSRGMSRLLLNFRRK